MSDSLCYSLFDAQVLAIRIELEAELVQVKAMDAANEERRSSGLSLAYGDGSYARIEDNLRSLQHRLECLIHEYSTQQKV